MSTWFANCSRRFIDLKNLKNFVIVATIAKILRNNKNHQFSISKKLGIFDDFTTSGSQSHIMEFRYWQITIS